MLVHEWPALLRVAVYAGLKVRLIEAGQVHAAVGIVAVGTLHQSLGHAMMNRQRELGLNRAMAAKAKRRARTASAGCCAASGPRPAGCGTWKK